MPDTDRPAARRRPWYAAAAAVVLLVLGFVVSTQLSGLLAISAEPVTAAPEDPQAAPAGTPVAAPDLTEVGTADRTQLTLAADAVVAALASRGTTATAVSDGGTPDDGGAPGAAGPGTLTVVTGVDLGTAPTSVGRDESYRLTSGDDGWLLEAATDDGAAHGLYTVADRIRTATDPLPAAEDGVVLAPQMSLRLVDKGATGIAPDPEAWRHDDPYSHNGGSFASTILSEAPYADSESFDADADDFRGYVASQLAQGFTGVVIPGFLEYVTFAGLDEPVYTDDAEHVARAETMQAEFGGLWADADDAGMDVYLQTDMLMLTTPLQAYLDERGLDTTDPELWEVYATGLTEVFETMPAVDGLMIRIGEAGRIYDLPGWDYWSELAVTDTESVRAMLTAFTDVAEQHGKDVIFRSWSVGVGAVGDMHTNPDSYEAVLAGVDSPSLVVSTKHVAGDFYSWLPLNPTLEIGDQRRIVELQSRREFEAFGALPNDLGSVYAEALAHYQQVNPHVEGVWAWAQDGGPWKAGPMSLYRKTGFWQLYDLNTYAAARLATDPQTDPGEITADWARATFSDDPDTVAAIGEAMALSRDAIRHGLYIGEFAENQVRALGLEPPPMMWIFEWDILSGDAAALDSISSIVGDDLDAALAEGHEAVAVAEEMRAVVAGTDAASWRDAGLREQFLAALDYQVDLFTVLADYRDVVLQHGRWLDTADPAAREAWAAARDAYEVSRAAHVATYGDDLDLPAYTFTAADLGIERAERDQAVAWVARVLGVLLVVGLLLGTGPGQRLLARTRRADDGSTRAGAAAAAPSSSVTPRAHVPGATALRALWLGATRPWRVAALAPAATRTDRVLVWVLPAAALVLSRVAYTWALSWVHLLLVLGAWLVFVAVLRLLVGRGDGFALAGAVGGAAVLRTVILLVALSVTGPGGYWYGLWADPTSRALYVTVAFAAFCWVLAAAWFALRSLGLGPAASAGRVLLATATPLLAGGLIVGAVGLETVLTAWNDQMMVLPWGLSRILGLTVHLGIPLDLPWMVAGLGAGLAVVGGLLAVAAALTGRRTARR